MICSHLAAAGRARNASFVALVLLLAVASLGALASCKKASTPSNASTGDDGGDQQVTARDYFINTVYPRIGGQSTCGGCHSGQANSPCSAASCVFLAADGPSSYDLLEKNVGLIAAPQNSPLVNYQHKDATIQLTPDQSNVMGIWLGMEAQERHLPGAVAKASNLQDAYTQFGKCMNYDVWVGTGMANLAQIETDFDGPCLGCHNKGQGSLFLAADPYATFQNFQKFPYIQKLVVGTVDSDGNFKELVPSGRIIEKSDEGCPEQDTTKCHPRFGLSDDEKASIEYFVNLTLQNLAANSCSNGIVTHDGGGIPEAGND